MKYIKLWGRHISMNKVDNFKWEWAVFYERFIGGEWCDRKVVVENRYNARIHMASMKIGEKFGKDMRNVRMKRRLVQVEWQDYAS